MQPRKPASIAALTFLLFVLSLSPVSVHAGTRRRAVAVSGPSTGLRVTFECGPLLDAGRITAGAGPRTGAFVRRTVNVRIAGSTSDARGTATLRAYLETPDPRATIRIDGIVLGATPAIVQRGVPIGANVPHRLEIEVPVSAPEGPLAASIGWEVTTE